MLRDYAPFFSWPYYVELSFSYNGRLQRWFLPYDYQVVQEDAKYNTLRDTVDSERHLELVSMLGPAATIEEERTYSMAQLPGQMSRKHTGFSFDSPGFESFFAMQEGVPTPHRSWDVARRASMNLPRRNTEEVLHHGFGVQPST